MSSFRKAQYIKLDLSVSFFKKIIFPFWTLKSVKRRFMMDYDQRVIIRFLSNKRITADKITTRFQAKFAEHTHKLRTIRFWIGEV
jgi:hypothetical protein